MTYQSFQIVVNELFEGSFPGRARDRTYEQFLKNGKKQV